ncbi:MAG: TM0106 family RecB-like putative nuclease [Elainella sp.]
MPELPVAASELWLTDDLLFQYQRCPRRAFLELYGDAALRGSPNDYVAKLRQDSLAHQRTVLAEQPAHRPQYSRKNWLEGATETLALMQQGVERISEGVLLVELGGLKLVSSPNLLIRQPGQSMLGDWIYEPADIRLGKRPKMDYQIVVAYHAYLLAAIQGVWPETGWLLLRQQGTCGVNLAEAMPRMQDLLRDCIQTLLPTHEPTGLQEPEVFIAHNRCDLCQWSAHCYGLAQAERHLSLLPGVTPSRYTYLKALGLTTVEALAAANPKQLENLPGFGLPVAQRLVKQAESVLTNRALPDSALPDRTLPDLVIPDCALPNQGGETGKDLLSAAELPTAPVELYFDIEAAPEQNLIYLHGVLVVDRQRQTETFHALIADSQAEEAQIWQQFLDLVWRYPDAPIFHFCPYELQTVRRLADLYGTPIELIEPLAERFVDLHERITRVAILPVESYALKPIARWLGFDWRDPEASGAQSICWYDQWMTTGDSRYREAILRYNEDDCYATYRIKDWLVEFCQGERRLG